MHIELRKKIIFLFFILILLILALVLKWFNFQLPHIGVGKDFAAYWASAQLLIDGQNPYLPSQIFFLQTSIGWTDKTPLVMYNPPWVLTFILPFSLDNYILGKLLWLLFIISCVIICSDWLWQFYGGTKANRHWNLLILLSYTPLYFALGKGQIVPLILLGIVGFLHFESQKKWFLAGAFASLLGIKPQVSYLLFIALLLWMVYKKRWDVLFGAGCVTFLIVVTPLYFNPDIFYQYYKEVVAHSFQYYWDTPTWGNLLRSVLGKEKKFLQYFPTIAGIAWLLYHWHHNCMKWVWAEQTPLLLFMSLMTTFYVWVNDYILLLVPITQASISLIHKPLQSYSKFIICAYITINLLAWVTAFSFTSEKWIIWMVPALFISYLLLGKISSKTNEESDQLSLKE